MFGGRRRQSIHGGLGLSPQKGSPFGRLGAKGGVSPRGSASNLHDSSRLGALSEAPDLPRTPEHGEDPSRERASHEGTNGVTDGGNLMDAPVPASGVNGTHEPTTLSDEQSSLAPPPTSHSQVSAPPTKDAEGFSIPAPVHDPISAAQREAAASNEDPEQLFKLNIQNQPVEEEDPQAKQAALSSVANSLKTGTAVRRTGTVRGRRDVRNTIYAPSPNVADGHAEGGFTIPGLPGSPSFPASLSRPTAAALASETSIAGTSDTQSIRSGNSLGSLAHVKHPEMTAQGLNASIIETVSAVFEGGVIKSSSIAGEIAFVNHASDENMFKSKFSASTSADHVANSA